MDYVRIQRITEAEFDAVVEAAGGKRIAEESSADYLFPSAVVEFKLVDEEGFEKATRREKVAAIFRAQQPDAPTVKIAPETLGPEEARAYYNAVAGPIKTHVKKAATQLDATRNRIDPSLTRVLIILNNGYTALSHEEFKSTALKCVQNDTRKIDWLIVGGLYYHSDTFDHYFLAPFEGLPIDVRCQFSSWEALEAQWAELSQQMITQSMLGSEPLEIGRMPVLDLVFELDGVRYVKEAPAMPESDFWPGGRRPRDNSSGIETCPPVALTFPKLSKESWKLFRRLLREPRSLRPTYREWIELASSQEAAHEDTLAPFIQVPVTVQEFEKWIQLPKSAWRFSDICEFSAEVFDRDLRLILDRVRSKEESEVLPVEYIHLIVKEIGSDKANDLSSLYRVSHVPGFERTEVIFENQRLFWEYGLSVAAAYAYKLGIGNVLYTRL